MRRVLLWSMAGLALGAIAYSAARLLHVKAQESSIRAFTAFSIERKYDLNGAEQAYEYQTHARRSDGSMVRAYRRKAPTGEWMLVKVIGDVPARRTFAVEPATRSVATYSLGPQGASVPACAPDANAERATMLGYEVARVERALSSPPEQTLLLESWVAPALNCFPLKWTATMGLTLGQKFRNVNEVLLVIEGEPAPSLFEIPADYKERPPSEIEAEFSKKFPGQRLLGEGVGSKLDDIYRAQQSRR